MDPTSIADAQNTKINLITDPRAYYLQDKITKELITHNGNNKSTFPTGALSFQASQQIKSSDDISFGVKTVIHFLGKRGENVVWKIRQTTTQRRHYI